MRQYLAMEINFDGEARLLQLTASLQSAQGTSDVTHVVVFDDGQPVEEYHYVPPQKERIGSYWPKDLPDDACMMSPMPLYGKKIIPERWAGPQAYT